ncbi:MAG: hypothetical protein E7376_00440 [Clostridiales bacterium]|nr:hypothetical protein [Clostridiales bacterium]
MSGVSTWVLSIAGVCLLSVLVDLILPDGKVNATIKHIFSFVIVLVVLMPLPGLVKGEYNLDNVLSELEFEIQDEYIYNVNQAKLDKWTEAINHDLETKGIHGAVVSISANIFEINMEINAVYVDLYNVVITENLKNINIKTEVVNVVKCYLNIEKSQVVFYE